MHHLQHKMHLIESNFQICVCPSREYWCDNEAPLSEGLKHWAISTANEDICPLFWDVKLLDEFSELYSKNKDSFFVFTHYNHRTNGIHSLLLRLKKLLNLPDVQIYAHHCVCVCVFVCVCVWERERERERESVWMSQCVCVLSMWLSVFVRMRHVDTSWICTAEEFLELYRKVEAVVRNCLLRWSGHLVEVVGTPLFDQSFCFKHISLFCAAIGAFSAGL